MTVKRKMPTTRPTPQPAKRPKINCVLILGKQHAEDLRALLEHVKREWSPTRGDFDKTPLGEVLTSLKSGPQGN